MLIKLDKKVIFNALIVAVVVGSILLIINQYDAIFYDAKFRVIPALLTYCVPFIVFIAGRLSSQPKNKTDRRSFR
ncbi:MAG: dihydrolipoamide dehydrogenase [SAR86 cluster bacterium]|uniref:Dihydrolipoamide dehydrogenase n=1 Tax=SAR86 cluster bacterium TaxID=2030880 RepID=A0A2A5C669_9GAMM|nr:MAG: dihydrolipoamide dehydrogenase [SAR86 cluster bacterium]